MVAANQFTLRASNAYHKNSIVLRMRKHARAASRVVEEKASNTQMLLCVW
jgi:hypothetical protein